MRKMVRARSGVGAGAGTRAGSPVHVPISIREEAARKREEARREEARREEAARVTMEGVTAEMIFTQGVAVAVQHAYVL